MVQESQRQAWQKLGNLACAAVLGTGSAFSGSQGRQPQLLGLPSSLVSHHVSELSRHRVPGIQLLPRRLKSISTSLHSLCHSWGSSNSSGARSQ